MEEVVEGKDGAQVTIYVNNLQKYMDSLVHQAPAYSSFLQRILSEEQRKTPDGVHAILYVDECVPGNILQPDNQRKSYCMILYVFLLQVPGRLQIYTSLVASGIAETLAN